MALRVSRQWRVRDYISLLDPAGKDVVYQPGIVLVGINAASREFREVIREIDSVGRGVDQFSCRNVAQALHRRSPIGPRFGLNVISGCLWPL